MKKFFRLVLVALGVVMAMSVVSCNKDNPETLPAAPAKYTIMLYGCGGSDIDIQLEVLTEVAPYCDYQFSSSHVAYACDFHVVALINALNAHPNDFEAAALEHKKLIVGNGKEGTFSLGISLYAGQCPDDLNMKNWH